MASESNDIPTDRGEPGQPAGRFQFGLKQLLALPILVALLCMVVKESGMICGGTLLLLFVCAAGLWSRWTPLTQFAAASFLLFAFLFAIFLPYADVGAERRECASQMRMLGLALGNYHAVRDQFPPAYVPDDKGRRMHSWRVWILPYLDEKVIYDQYDFDEPWNGPGNGQLTREAPWPYRCPMQEVREDASPGMTSYLAVVGPRTAWSGAKSAKLDDFSDGASNTILLAEVCNSGVNWLEPRDLHVVQMAPGVNANAGQGISGQHVLDGANVLFADGSVRFLSTAISAEAIDAMITIDGGESIDWKALQAQEKSYPPSNAAR